MANLVQFLTQQRDAARTQKDGAVQDVSNAKSAAETRRGELVSATATLNSKLQEIAAIKRKLAVIPTPDDGAALLRDLTAATLAAHAAQADVLNKTAAADDASALLAERGAGLQDLLARLTSLESMLAEALPLDQTRTQLKQAATSDVRQSATDALNNAPFTAAKTRIEAEFPTKLRDRARASADVELNRTAIAAAARDRADSALNNTLDPVQKARMALGAADAALAEYVKGAAGLLQNALETLTRVADPAKSPLSQPEKDAIAADQAREDAADKEIELSHRQKALDTAQDAVDAAATPSQAQIDARNAALAARDLAQQAVTQAVKDTLHAWEAAVPEANWQLFADFEDARRTLEYLRDTDPGALVTAVNNAENDVVAAVQAAATSSSALTVARAAAAKRDFLVTIGEKNAGVRILSALRGDA